MAVNLKDLSWKKLVLACLLGMSFGLIVVAFPDLLLREGDTRSLVGFLDHSLMTTSIVQTLLLPAAGLLWGMFFRWPYAICAAISGVACLPAIVIMKIIEDPTSHNLWPFEFIAYAFLAVVAAGAAVLGVLLKKTLKAREKTVTVGS